MSTAFLRKDELNMEEGNKFGILSRLIVDSEDKKSIFDVFGGFRNFYLTEQLIQDLDESCYQADKHIFLRHIGESAEEASKKMLSLTRSWDAAVRPSLMTTAELWLSVFDIDPDEPMGRLLKLVAARAEIVRGQNPYTSVQMKRPAYHNQVHFMHVFQTGCYLMQALREFPEAEELSKDDIATVMIALMAHDIDHPGGGNPHCAIAKGPELFHYEDNSFYAIAPLIKAVLPPEKAEVVARTVQTYLRFTDPNVPRKDLREYAQQIADGGEFPFPKHCYDRQERHPFWIGAEIVSDADILSASGMGADLNKRASRTLTEEFSGKGIKMDFTTPQSAMFFFDNIVGESYLSRPARKIFHDNFRALREEKKALLEQKAPG